ncbi:MAG: hypothetical protein AABX37_02470 [Nanoarchaeota archaeon]
MNLIEQSFSRLFPEKPFEYNTKLEYNRRLGDFNANISFHQNTINVNLNLQWKDIDSEIKIGLIQHLLLKIFKQRKHSQNIDLYNNFVKQIPTFVPKTKTDPFLQASFHRMNDQFFYNQLEQPNVMWGQPSFRRLAHYNFHNDTITVSSLFCTAPMHILDYLMYHELLHKHHQFKHHNGRSRFHTTAFKEDEARYPHQQNVEKEIEQIIKLQKRKSGILSWFR